MLSGKECPVAGIEVILVFASHLVQCFDLLPSTVQVAALSIVYEDE